MTQKHCMPCSKDAVVYSPQKVQEAIASLLQWSVSADGKWLERGYKFKNFRQALAFVNKAGEIAEAENHHPDITFGWGYANFRLQTHAVGGLHDNDFILAHKIEAIQ